MENVRKHRDIKLVTTDKRKNQLTSEPNYHTSKYFSENLLAIETKKTKIKTNKPAYLGMSILDISKHLCMNFGMIILKQSIKTEQNYAIWILTALLFMLKLKIFTKILPIMLKNGSKYLTDECNSVEDGCNFIDERPLPIGKNKKKKLERL